MANPSKATEILNGSIEDIITINSVEDFKSKLNISSLPEGELKEFFGKPIETTQSELTELRKQYLTGKPDLTTVKNFLETSRNKVLETAKQGLREVKKIAENISTSINYEKQGNLEHTKTAEKAEAGIEAALGLGNKTGGELLEKTKELGTQAQTTIKKGVETVKTGGFLNILTNLKDKGGVLGFFAGILLGIFKIFGLGKKVEDLKEKVKGKLSPKGIDETKKKINNTFELFVENFNEKTKLPILPKNKANILALFNKPGFFTESQLINISEKLKSGTFKLSDLKSIFPDKDNERYKEINRLLFTEDQKELLKSDLINRSIEAITREYNIDLSKLDKEKHEELRNLFQDNGINKDFIELSEKYEKGGFISFGEIFKNGVMIIPNAMILSIKLISIIPFVNIAENLARSTSTLLELATGNATEENIILKRLEKLDGEQKNMVLGIMLRKGMFIFNIIERITYSLTRTIAETIIGGKTISSVEGVKAIAFDDYKKQGVLIDRMLDSLGVPEGNKLQSILKGNINDLIKSGKKAKNISIIMDNLNEMEKKGLSTLDIKEKLRNNVNIKALGIDVDLGDIKTLLGKEINSFSNNFNANQDSKIWKYLQENKLGLSKESYLSKAVIEQSNNLKALGKEWKRSLGQGMLGKYAITHKLGAMMEGIRFNQTTRNLEIHALDMKEGLDKIKKIEKLNALGLKIPALAGSLVGTAGIVLTVSSIGNIDENSMEELAGSLQYLIPTYGPIKVLLNDSGIQNISTNSLRDNLKLSGETAPMIMFLGMDLAYIGSQITKGVANKEVLKPLQNLLNYHVKVFTSPYNLGVAVKDITKSGIEAFKAPKGDVRILNHYSKKVLQLVKKVPKSAAKIPPIKWILGIAAISGISATLLMDNTTDKLKKELNESGFIKKDGEFDYKKIKQQMSDDEKEELLKYFVWGDRQNLDIKINLDKLTITSNDKNLKYKTTIINNKILELLKNIGINTTDDDCIKFINSN